MKKFNTEALLKDKEVTPAHYEEMLGCLPPERMCGNAFLVGEPVDHAKDASGQYRARYELYFEESRKFYFGGLCSTSDFDAFVISEVSESGRCICGCHEIFARPSGCTECKQRHQAPTDKRTDNEKDGSELAAERKCVGCTDSLEQNDDLYCGACSFLGGVRY